MAISNFTQALATFALKNIKFPMGNYQTDSSET